jgi:hypothetical protein
MMSRSVMLLTLCVAAIVPAIASATPSVPVKHDGSHDFDFELGVWRTSLKRLRHPLSGSTEWVEYSGTTTVSGLLGSRANLAELAVKGEQGSIEGASLRLYDVAAGQWTLNFFNVADGRLTAPMWGGFTSGRGVFYGQDTLGGRAILVRFFISQVSPDVYRFEQSFSADAGQTWEINWIATDTRQRVPRIADQGAGFK